MAPTLLLDLDGTLVDSVPDLLASANRLMVTRGLAPFRAADIIPMVGDGAGVLVRRLLAARDREATPADRQEFLADYTANVAVATRAYPGVPEGLARLAAAGWRLAVCTNKPEAPARAVLDKLGLLPLFAAVGGGDSYATRKPDPAHLIATLRDAGGDRDQAVMVGDHHNDMAAAAAAGLPSIFASWGYGHDTGATATAAHFSEVPDLAAGLIGS